MQFTLTELWHHMGLFARIIVGDGQVIELNGHGSSWVSR